VHGVIGKEVALHVLHHGKDGGAIQVKVYEEAVAVNAVKKYANVRNLHLNVDVLANGGTVYNAGHVTLSAQSIELTGATHLTLADLKSKICHCRNDDLEIKFLYVVHPTSVRDVCHPPGLSRPIHKKRADTQNATKELKSQEKFSIT
jgi:putative NIF3 family GTP cyclohydrolase 1 type 2